MAKELLKDVTIRNAKPTDKDQRLNDGERPVLCSLSPMALNGGDSITPLQASAKLYQLGFILTTGLADARRKAEEARDQCRQRH